MNKVIAIHLHGIAFQLEEEGYDALRTYLDGGARTLAANPDRAEILADIEQAIGDKFRALLSDGRNVILAPDVKAVLAAMGPVSDDSTPPDGGGAEATDHAAAAATASRPNPGADAGAASAEPIDPPRRLYTLSEGAVLFGVCNGLAAYLGIDVMLVRLVCVLLCFFSFGTLAILYFLAATFIPEANTPEEKAAARAPSSTSRDFVRRAAEGYYEGMKSMPDREARRAWKRKFRREMRHKFGRGWDYTESACGSAAPLPAVAHLLLSLLSTLKGLITLLAVIVALSLLFTGSILGAPFPNSIPHWLGLLLLFLAYKIVVAPLKIARRAIWHRHMSGTGQWRWRPFVELWNGLVAIGFVVLFIWLADRFIPQFHDILQHLPVLLHQIADSVREWWKSGG